MSKKVFLFVTAILVATSASTGYGANDMLKGNVNASTFLDWFHNSEKYLHLKALIILDLIPAIFLIIQTIIFFKDNKKLKGSLAALALILNLIGIFILVQYAYPIASQMNGWIVDKLPSDWISLKDSWLGYIGIYGLTGVLGWLSFVITFFIPQRKNEQNYRLPRFLNFLKNALLFLLTFILGMGAARLYESFLFPFSEDISGATFIEIHRPLDIAIRKVGPILFTIISIVHVIIASLFFFEKNQKKGWLIIASLLFLLCDTFIALQYNGPLNDLFLTWTPSTLPENWSSLRDEWLSYHLYRNVFITLGIIAILLTFFVHENKSLNQDGTQTRPV